MSASRHRSKGSRGSDDGEKIDSMLFSGHNPEEVNALIQDYQQFRSISFVEEDPDLPPTEEEIARSARGTRCSVLPTEELDTMREQDFPDFGKRFDKSPEDAARIVQEIRAVVLFDGYDESELMQVSQFMHIMEVEQGQVVIQQGAAGSAFYVVKSGIFHCSVPDVESPLHVYDGQGYFGELALINGAPRAADVTAMTAGALWVLHSVRYSWLRLRRAVDNAERFERVLRAIPLFRDNLPSALTNRLIDAIEMVRVAPGDVICRQGEPGDAMYFVVEGEVEASISEKAVRTMRQNDFFGERALVLEEDRAATCRARTSGQLAKLHKESFQLLIPDAVLDKMHKYISATYVHNSSSSSGGDSGEFDDDDENLSTASVYMEYLCQDVNTDVR